MCAMPSLQLISASVFLFLLVGALFPSPSDACKKVTKDITVTYEGCEPTTTSMKVCEGSCISYNIGIPDSPNLQHCNCCAASEYIVKLKKVMFNCGGVMQEKRLYIPRVHECNCIECNGTQ